MGFDPLPHHPPLPALVRGRTNPPVVIVPGFAMLPRTYAWTADLLAPAHCVIVPEWSAVERPWTYDKALAGILATADQYHDEPFTLIGHSFGGGLAVGLAARRPDRVRRLIVSDSLGLAPRWRLATSFVRGIPFVRLATYRAAVDFFTSWRRHTESLVRASWWGFTNHMGEEIAAIRDAGIPCHVLWAQRDTMLEKDDGRHFAEMLGASFHVVDPPEDGGPVDHDWVYRHPLLFVSMLHRLGVETPFHDGVVKELTDDRISGTPGA